MVVWWFACPRWGHSHPSCIGCGGGPHAVVAGVVAAPQRQAVKKPCLGKRWQQGCLIRVLNALACQMKLRGWWHTFPRHRLSLRLTHFLVKVLVACAHTNSM